MPLFKTTDVSETPKIEITRWKIYKVTSELCATINHPSPPKYLPPIEYIDIWSTWQIWVLMREFGKYINMGTENCFELTIEIVEP